MITYNQILRLYMLLDQDNVVVVVVVEMFIVVEIVVWRECEGVRVWW